MRFAFVSDLHANLQAWTAVLMDARCSSVDRIVCLGDVVGYGPHPAEVLRSVHAEVDHIVLGNHDAAACGKLDDSLFNEGARQIIEWTRTRLNARATKFLRSLPLSLASPWFRCAHGEFSEPQAFHYVIDPEDAMPSWQAREEPLLFVGHTHDPRIFLLGPSGVPRVVPPQDFVLEEGKRYLVNVGSVGQPRDGEPRACYCLFDTDERSVRWRRIPFDVDAFRAALSAAGLPAKPSYFLRHDPREGRPPLRELLNFSPPESPEQAVRDAIPVQELASLRRRVTTWRLVSAVAAGVAAAAVLGGTALWWRQANRALVLAAPDMTAIAAGARPGAGVNSRQRGPIPERGNLLAAPDGAWARGQPIAGWRVELSDRRQQQILVAPHGDEFVFQCSSRRPAALRLVSRPIRASSGDRFRLYAEFAKSDDFSGELALLVNVSSGGRPVEYAWRRNPPDTERDGWWIARKVFPEAGEVLPEGRPLVEIEVSGRFTGEVRVRRVGLGRIE